MNLRLGMVLVAVLPASAIAQQETRANPADQPAAARTAPVLNGHTFMPTFIVDTPFRETTFRLGLLYGFGSATGPRYDIHGNPIGTADYTFASFAQTFRFDYQFLEWLSAGATIITSLYSGIDGPSVVSIGAQVGVGAGLNVKAGYRFGPVQTAIGLDVSNSPQYGFLIAATLIKAVQQGVIDPGTALQANHVRTVNPFAAASWAPFPALGLTANFGYLYKELRLSGVGAVDHQNGLQFGMAADFDFAKISSVPIGLLAAYRISAPIGDSDLEKIDDITGGIFYTAQREISLGLEVGWRSFTIRPPLDSTMTFAQLGLQYYW
ncbi:MAG TPA: hypothetical protein VEP66_17045 [Myxococcales bacterium]|nr:hypothetical protein [Myxococcales bacterium]